MMICLMHWLQLLKLLEDKEKEHTIKSLKDFNFGLFITYF